MKCFSRTLGFSFLSPVIFGALVNHTVDDDNTMIKYRGSWPESRSTMQSALDYGGSHMVSSVPGDTAVFTFTGVAVYYLSPFWPYAVSTSLSLDGGPQQYVNLTDPYTSPTNGGPESSPWGIRWSATNLTNGTHALIASIARGGVYVVVDGFTYTTDDPSSDLINKANLVPTIVGVAIGVFLAIGAVSLGYYCYHRRKGRHNQAFQRLSNSRRYTSEFLESEFRFQSPLMENEYFPHDYINNRALSSAEVHADYESSRSDSGHRLPTTPSVTTHEPSTIQEKTRMSFSSTHEDFTIYEHLYPNHIPMPFSIGNGPESASGSSSTRARTPPQQMFAEEKRLQREVVEAQQPVPSPPAYTK